MDWKKWCGKFFATAHPIIVGEHGNSNSNRKSKIPFVRQVYNLAQNFGWSINEIYELSRNQITLLGVAGNEIAAEMSDMQSGDTIIDTESMDDLSPEERISKIKELFHGG